MKQNLGDRISFYRKNKGYTQEDLAEKVGVSSRAVSKWENNISHPSFNNIERLSEILSVDINDLLNLSGDVKQNEIQLYNNNQLVVVNNNKTVIHHKSRAWFIAMLLCTLIPMAILTKEKILPSQPGHDFSNSVVAAIIAHPFDHGDILYKGSVDFKELTAEYFVQLEISGDKTKIPTSGVYNYEGTADIVENISKENELKDDNNRQLYNLIVKGKHGFTVDVQIQSKYVDQISASSLRLVSIEYEKANNNKVLMNAVFQVDTGKYQGKIYEYKFEM